MTAPIVASTSSGTGGGSSTAITIPAGSVGETIVVLFGVDGVPTVTHTGTGWTQTGLVGTQASGYVFTKIASGADTLTVNYSAAEVTGYYVYRITGAHASTPPEAAAVIGTSATPDPPNLAPSWGAEDNLWVAGFALDDGTKTLSSYPTNYSDNQATVAGSTAGVRLGIATRELNASSENPGSFTVSASDSWVALTIAVRPAAGGGGGGTTITAAVGAASAVGVTAKINRSINAQAGAAAATGTTARISVAVACGPGAASATGTQAHINVSLRAGTGSAAAAGVAASIVTEGDATISAQPGNAVAAAPGAHINLSIRCTPAAAGAAGVTAQLHRIFGMRVGNAIAAGITASIDGAEEEATTPAARSFYAPAEARALYAPAENRSLLAPAEDRELNALHT
jgi:hypothetical protein